MIELLIQMIEKSINTFLSLRHLRVKNKNQTAQAVFMNIDNNKYELIHYF